MRNNAHDAPRSHACYELYYYYPVGVRVLVLRYICNATNSYIYCCNHFVRTSTASAKWWILCCYVIPVFPFSRSFVLRINAWWRNAVTFTFIYWFDNTFRSLNIVDLFHTHSCCVVDIMWYWPKRFVFIQLFRRFILLILQVSTPYVRITVYDRSNTYDNNSSSK